MGTVQERFEETIQKACKVSLKAEEEYISSLYTDGRETVDFRFDAFSMWGANTAGPAFWKDFPIDLPTDNWSRSVWSLTKEQALAIGKYVEEWNADWEYEIAGKFAEELHASDPDFDQNYYYNAYRVSFWAASGTEHVISVRTPNGHYNESWQWN